MFSRDYGDLSILLIYIYFQLIFFHSGISEVFSNKVYSAAALRKCCQNKLNLPRWVYMVLHPCSLTSRTLHLGGNTNTRLTLGFKSGQRVGERHETHSCVILNTFAGGRTSVSSSSFSHYLGSHNPDTELVHCACSHATGF